MTAESTSGGHAPASAPETPGAARARRPRAAVAALVIGALAVLLVSMGAVLIASRAGMGERLASSIDYVRRQSVTYDSYNEATVMKSSMRLLENASSAARGIAADDGDVSQANLLSYCSELRLTGLVILDASGRVVSECSTDGTTSSDVSQVLSREELTDVADNPEKVYVCRASLADGSYADVAAACRTDVPGVVVALYHTRLEFANKYSLTFQSLLDGYSTVDGGVVAIEREGGIIASNDTDLADPASAGDAAEGLDVIDKIKARSTPDEVVVVHRGAAAYLGMMSRAGDYYVYAYVPLVGMLRSMLFAGAAALVLYVLVVVFVGVAHRRSEQRQLRERVEREHEYNERLSATAREARDANRAKTEFLRRMSHDIRTPINGIRGMVEMGDAFPDDAARQAECRRKIWGASELLLSLVNEVLDMSKLDGGKVRLEESPVDLRVLLGEVRSMVEAQAAARRVRLVSEPTVLAHPCVYASPTHVKRLIMNILSNAVKYNREGGSVRTSIEEVSFSGGVGTYRFTCVDTGIGMTPEFQRHLFEPFAQERCGEESSLGGTGLGMPITKSLVELMGGTIDFTSAPGVGTTFVVTLPLRACDESLCAPAELAGGAAAPSLVGMRVLLAEDNELNREIATFFLESAGAEVTCACDGGQAVEMFRESAPGHFDAVLMDIMMPVMDGLEATRAIRALDRPDARGVPVIALTANAFADDVRASREAGIDAHLAKPLDSKLLVRTLASLREKRQ